MPHIPELTIPVKDLALGDLIQIFSYDHVNDLHPRPWQNSAACFDLSTGYNLLHQTAYVEVTNSYELRLSAMILLGREAFYQPLATVRVFDAVVSGGVRKIEIHTKAGIRLLSSRSRGIL